MVDNFFTLIRVQKERTAYQIIVSYHIPLFFASIRQTVASFTHFLE